MPTKRKAASKKFAPRVKRIVQSMVEEKHIEQFTPAQNVRGDVWMIGNVLCTQTASATDAAGSGIVQGNADNQRIGDRVRLKKIEINFFVSPVVAAVDATGSACRILLVHDKQPVGGYPATTTIMNSNFILANQNLVNKKRFTILKDIVHQMTWLGNTTTTPNAAGPELIGKFVIYPKYELNYNTTTGITSAQTNHAFYLMAINDTGAATVCCNLQFNTQTTYTDA